MAKVELVVFNEVRIATKLSNMANALVDTKPLMEEVADYIFDRAEGKFQSQGRAGGGSWQQLTPKWLKYKVKHGFDPRILHKQQNHPLRTSVSRRGAPNQILKIERYRLQVGSNLPYAATHQFGDSGKRNIAARPYLVVNRQTRETIRTMVRDHIMKEWRGV